MELKITRSDLDAMPSDLRHRLLHYLESGRTAPAPIMLASALDRQEVAALLRDISFHRMGRLLRALLDRLAYEDFVGPPGQRKLGRALPRMERPQLGRYVALLNQIAAKAAKRRNVQFCSFDLASRAYTVHPATRRWLRELLPGIERAGEQEEPLWE